MKTRHGFVSNSSSSSFVVSRHHLTARQIRLLEDHAENAEDAGMCCNDDDRWSITVRNLVVEGSTIMDNFDMCEYMSRIGIDTKLVKWR